MLDIYSLFLLKSAYEDSWFEGTLLISLLRDTIILPQGHETDLLHGMDRWRKPVFLQRVNTIAWQATKCSELHLINFYINKSLTWIVTQVQTPHMAAVSILNVRSPTNKIQSIPNHNLFMSVVQVYCHDPTIQNRWWAVQYFEAAPVSFLKWYLNLSDWHTSSG